MAFSSSLRCILACAFLASCLRASSADGGWTTARATWFDVGDMSKANCHFSWAPTGRNVGAWPDQQSGFSSSCGKCYEVKCRNANIVDGYGQSLQRTNACYDENKSVIITIVDACPCKYPNNAYSNQRWCCGDMNHVDISQEAFQQLANLDIGVIGLSYREVDCSKAGTQGDVNSGSASSPSSSGSKSAGSGYSTGTGSTQQQQGQQSAPAWASWAKGWSGGRWRSRSFM
ncbi:hypothetical protein Agub_g4179 [Astrephomene gubernaculifera]|uniref:Expansin-like EG45 domain-containing protein n=1 Tax=Astrephomene gubernaculifera TaxID=47775 RepID=A0AAD3DLX0_9CHLO|nr:hypothetical protein Agub_g4179 [Astrephomene gubernaculifera]